VSVLVALTCLGLLLLAPPPAGSVQSVEYTLQIASLLEDAFVHFMPRLSMTDEGRMDGMERALDSGTVDSGAFLYDRELSPVDSRLARSLGASPVAPTGQIVHGRGGWQSVRWQGTPGDRAVWAVESVSTHRQRVTHLALSANGNGLEYVRPYRATLSPSPMRAVTYRLPVLRSGTAENPVWERFLSRSVDLRGGVAAVVGENSVNAGDWIFLLVDQPSEPTTFKVVAGWGRGISEEQLKSGRGGIRLK
jgi:hypothetical protein